MHKSKKRRLNQLGGNGVHIQESSTGVDFAHTDSALIRYGLIVDEQAESPWRETLREDSARNLFFTRWGRGGERSLSSGSDCPTAHISVPK